MILFFVAWNGAQMSVQGFHLPNFLQKNQLKHTRKKNSLNDTAHLTKLHLKYDVKF